MKIEEIKKAFLEFIQIPSITGSSGEEQACSYLEDILRNNGIESERISKIASRPNLLAKLQVKNAVREPLVLISHIDVVNGIQENWTHPIFGAETAEGRIWGRGTLDTKQLTMMELFAFLHLKEYEACLDREVWFLATIDEEGGSSYGMEYVKSVKPELFRNALVISEGGGFPLLINGKKYMMLTMGEKAVCKVGLWADGTGGHASAPGDNQAMLKLAEGLKHIFGAQKELRCGSSAIYQEMKNIVGCDEWDNSVGRDILEYAGQNSITARSYQIGERCNVIPSKAELLLEIKVLPYAKLEDINQFLKKQLEETAVQYEILEYQEGFECSADNPNRRELVQELEAACQRNGFDGRVLPMLALGRTDGRFFGNEESMVFGCSPVLMGDSFDRILPKVHGNDESILEDSFLFGCRVLDEVMQRLARITETRE